TSTHSGPAGNSSQLWQWHVSEPVSPAAPDRQHEAPRLPYPGDGALSSSCSGTGERTVGLVEADRVVLALVHGEAVLEILDVVEEALVLLRIEEHPDGLAVLDEVHLVFARLLQERSEVGPSLADGGG